MYNHLKQIKFLLSQVEDENSQVLERLDTEFEKVLKFGTADESDEALQLIQEFLLDVQHKSVDKKIAA